MIRSSDGGMSRSDCGRRAGQGLAW